MAVYTDITDEELTAFIAGYDLGNVLSAKGIAEGVENSNFLLVTEAGQFILTLYEKRVEAADLPFFLGLMEHLVGQGISCPLPVHARSGEILGSLAQRPAAIVTFLPGMWVRRPRNHHCSALGDAMAKLHSGGQRVTLSQEKTRFRLKAGGRCSPRALAEPMRSPQDSTARYQPSSISSTSTGRAICPPE